MDHKVKLLSDFRDFNAHSAKRQWSNNCPTSKLLKRILLQFSSAFPSCQSPWQVQGMQPRTCARRVVAYAAVDRRPGHYLIVSRLISRFVYLCNLRIEFFISESCLLYYGKRKRVEVITGCSEQCLGAFSFRRLLWREDVQIRLAFPIRSYLLNSADIVAVNLYSSFHNTLAHFILAGSRQTLYKGEAKLLVTHIGIGDALKNSFLKWGEAKRESFKDVARVRKKLIVSSEGKMKLHSHAIYQCLFAPNLTWCRLLLGGSNRRREVSFKKHKVFNLAYMVVCSFDPHDLNTGNRRSFTTN